MSIGLALLLLFGCGVKVPPSSPSDFASNQGHAGPSAQPAPEQGSAPQTPQTPQTLDAGHERALSLLLSGKEPDVKDAIWTSPNSLKVGVVDNGTPRDAYADYLCVVLERVELPSPLSIRVTDYHKLRASNDSPPLGKSTCP